MKKYKDYRYTTKKWSDGKYTWHIRANNGDELQTGSDSFDTKDAAEIDCLEHIDEYYY